jgi:membrane protease YdiL (CAAX protease family)
MTKQNSLSIITFFTIAFGLTFAFSKLTTIPFYSVDIKDILCGFGPAISGIICYKLFPTPTTYSVSGTQPTKIWLIFFISVTIFVLTNSKNSLGFNILFVLTQVIYCFGEEFGWRHFLQSATNQTNKWLQPTIIGLIWFSWHFSWLQEPLKAMLGQNFNAPLPLGLLIGIISLSLFSMFLGWTIQKTNSIIIPTLIHFSTKSNSITLMVTIILIVAAILSWDKVKIGKKILKNNVS